MITFTLNHTTYETDAETAALLKSLIDEFRAGKTDDTPACAVLELGLKVGCIRQVTADTANSN
jgi:hypothetical protein